MAGWLQEGVYAMNFTKRQAKAILTVAGPVIVLLTLLGRGNIGERQKDMLDDMKSAQSQFNSASDLELVLKELARVQAALERISKLDRAKPTLTDQSDLLFQVRSNEIGARSTGESVDAAKRLVRI